MKSSSPDHPAAKNPSVCHLCPEALDWLLTQLSATTLSEAVKSRPAWSNQLCKGGFQMTPQTISTPAMRERLRQLLLRNPASADELLRLLYLQKGPWHASFALLELLGPQWMLNSWRLLLETLPDPRPFIMAMSFPDCEDPALPRLAGRLLRCPSVWKNREQTDQAGNVWIDFAKTVLPPVKTLRTREDCAAAAVDHGPTPADADQAGDKLKNQNKQLKSQNRQLTDALDQERAKTRELDHLFREQKHRQEEARQVDEREHQEIAARHQQELSRREHEFQHRLEQEMQAFKQQFLAIDPQWRELARKQRQDNDGLLQQVETAIQNQHRLNEKHGCRSLLLAEQDRLEKAHERINALLADAVVVADDLPNLIPELQKRQQEISELLNVSRPAYQPASGLPLLIAAKIKSADLAAVDADSFQRFEDLIRLAARLELIPPAEAEGLRQTVASRVHQKHLLEHSPQGRPLPKAKLEVWSILRFLAQLPQTAIIIDGYNAIKCSKHWAEWEQKHSLNEARHDFLEACRRKKHFFREWVIVFDGNDPILSNLEKEDDGMTVVFAAKKNAEHNADDYIIEYLKSLPRNGKPVWLVTGDLGLRHQADPFCQAFVTVEALEDFLHPGT